MIIKLIYDENKSLANQEVEVNTNPYSNNNYLESDIKSDADKVYINGIKETIDHLSLVKLTLIENGEFSLLAQEQPNLVKEVFAEVVDKYHDEFLHYMYEYLANTIVSIIDNQDE